MFVDAVEKLTYARGECDECNIAVGKIPQPPVQCNVVNYLFLFLHNNRGEKYEKNFL